MLAIFNDFLSPEPAINRQSHAILGLSIVVFHFIGTKNGEQKVVKAFSVCIVLLLYNGYSRLFEWMDGTNVKEAEEFF